MCDAWDRYHPWDTRDRREQANATRVTAKAGAIGKTTQGHRRCEPVKFARPSQPGAAAHIAKLRLERYLRGETAPGPCAV